MFEFAISLNKRHRPTKIIFASWIISCCAHLLFFTILVENPKLLRGGFYHQFRAFPLIRNMWPTLNRDKKDKEKDAGRIVTVLKPMEAPSLAMLKKYMEQDLGKKEDNSPPVHVKWKENPKADGNKKNASTPKAQEPKIPDIAPPPQTASSGTPFVQGSKDSEIKQPGGGSSGSQIASQNDAARRGTMPLPPPAPIKTDTTDKSSSAGIGDTKKTPVEPIAKNQNAPNPFKVFENEKEAILSPESGFIVPDGFPLGEYASQINEKIKAHWWIPTNLKNSQGRTTVIFSIAKSGKLFDVRIVTGSGNHNLDMQALNAIIGSDPAPPLPKGFTGDHIGAKFIFSYAPSFANQ
jgi:TonB family protein